MRVVQPEGRRGSLKWIQCAVARKLPSLEQPILLGCSASAIEWRSPLAPDNFAEYRDGAFLDLLGIGGLKTDLKEFWPVRGPQWDALGVTDRRDVLLVEAKAHVGEMCTPPSQASAASRAHIEISLATTAASLRARADRAPWISHFYQLANRLAHLHFLRSRGVPAWLVLVNFVGDVEMGGPSDRQAWKAAYQVAWHVMGISNRHSLARYVIEVFPNVREMQ